MSKVDPRWTEKKLVEEFLRMCGVEDMRLNSIGLMEGYIQQFKNDAIQSLAARQAAEAKARRYEEALRWYLDILDTDEAYELWFEDNGQRAREALAAGSDNEGRDE